MKLDHIARPSARLYLLIMLIGLFLGVTLALPAPVFAQDGTFPTMLPTVTPNETPAPTAEPVTQDGTPEASTSTTTTTTTTTETTTTAPLTALVNLVTQFATLAGVAALVAATINALKLTPLINDGNTGPWYAGLSLLAFGALAYFGIFNPDVSLLALNDMAAQAATVLFFVTGYLTQTGVGQLWHGVLKQLNIPLVSTSFTEPLPAIQPRPLSRKS